MIDARAPAAVCDDKAPVGREAATQLPCEGDFIQKMRIGIENHDEVKIALIEFIEIRAADLQSGMMRVLIPCDLNHFGRTINGAQKARPMREQCREENTRAAGNVEDARLRLDVSNGKNTLEYLCIDAAMLIPRGGSGVEIGKHGMAVVHKTLLLFVIVHEFL